jgi:Predicted AAA-ATPase
MVWSGARHAGMKIPYGIANFADVRSGGYFYIDKTPFLPVLEAKVASYLQRRADEASW